MLVMCFIFSRNDTPAQKYFILKTHLERHWIRGVGVRYIMTTFIEFSKQWKHASDYSIYSDGTCPFKLLITSPFISFHILVTLA